MKRPRVGYVELFVLILVNLNSDLVENTYAEHPVHLHDVAVFPCRLMMPLDIENIVDLRKVSCSSFSRIPLNVHQPTHRQARNRSSGQVCFV